LNSLLQTFHLWSAVACHRLVTAVNVFGSSL
jgi:hypothetical protein